MSRLLVDLFVIVNGDVVTRHAKQSPVFEVQKIFILLTHSRCICLFAFGMHLLDRIPMPVKGGYAKPRQSDLEVKNLYFNQAEVV